LYGNPAGLEMVYEITRKYNLSLISDASQAHGALIDNRSITDFADITTYSYYPAKNLGAFGDAGAVATNYGRVAEKIRLLRNHGRKEKYLHEIEASNCRMDTIQAAVLNVKLRYLEKWNNSRINMAKLYNTLLSEKGYFIPEIDERYRSVYHLYVTRLEDREIVMKKLKEAGVSTGIHYPFPLHLQPAYEYLGSKKGDFPVSEELSEKVLSLPIDGCITPEEIEYIVGVLPVLF
jgi:dTDP-4-amino-4,6-dideoxygalactose transaminase